MWNWREASDASSASGLEWRVRVNQIKQWVMEHAIQTLTNVIRRSAPATPAQAPSAPAAPAPAQKKTAALLPKGPSVSLTQAAIVVGAARLGRKIQDPTIESRRAFLGLRAIDNMKANPNKPRAPNADKDDTAPQTPVNSLNSFIFLPALLLSQISPLPNTSNITAYIQFGSQRTPELFPGPLGDLMSYIVSAFIVSVISYFLIRRMVFTLWGKLFPASWLLKKLADGESSNIETIVLLLGREEAIKRLLKAKIIHGNVYRHVSEGLKRLGVAEEKITEFHIKVLEFPSRVRFWDCPTLETYEIIRELGNLGNERCVEILEAKLNGAPWWSHDNDRMAAEEALIKINSNKAKAALFKYYAGRAKERLVDKYKHAADSSVLFNFFVAPSGLISFEVEAGGIKIKKPGQEEIRVQGEVTITTETEDTFYAYHTIPAGAHPSLQMKR